MLRIGEINYLNCTPIFAALRSMFPDSGYNFVSGTPAQVNAMLRAGTIDLSPSSSIEYARNPDSYLIIPELSISSFGPVKSVMLFARVPIEELDGTTIALSGESATSVALLKILLARRYGYTNSFVSVSGRSVGNNPEFAATLLIGDSAMRQVAANCHPHVYDLGELWYEFTGLPFVFALWLLRKAVNDDMPVEAQLLHARLLAAKSEAVLKFAELAGELREIRWTNCEYLIKYWQNISYDLTPMHIAGLQQFYRYAAEEALLDGVPVMHMLGGGTNEGVC